jgi:hypothetical protein
MNDFELQRQLRAMNAPRPPQNDLWSGIAERIAADDAVAAATQRRKARVPLAAAAALLAFVVTGSLMLGLRGPGNDVTQQSGADPSLASSQKLRDFARDARSSSRAPGGDPRLVGAAVVLDAAHAELEQALEQRPDAVFLVSLLNRTNARRMKLDHFGANAG